MRGPVANGRFDTSDSVPFTAATSSPVTQPQRAVVAGLGLIVLDEQMFVERYPDVDTKVFAAAHRTQIGGPVPTALAQLQRFGVETCFLGCWASDAAGSRVEQGLSQAGIAFETGDCRRAAATGVAHVWVERSTGRRTIVSRPPDGFPESSQTQPFAGSARLLHLDGWGGDAAIAAAETIRSKGGIVTFDCGSAKSTTASLLRLADVVNTPRRFLQSWSGSDDLEHAAGMLLDLGPKLVTVTDGEHGAGLFTADVSIWRPAFPVRSVDTCGAGDVFCGGLIFSVLAGHEPEATLEFAMATAALKVTRPGNRDLADYDEVVSFLEETGTR